MLRRPIVQLNADSIPLNETVMQRLISLSLVDNKNLNSDELNLTLSDYDGALELPKRGVKLMCWLGYEDSGTVFMGTFIVDSSEWSGTPDIVTVKAKSADFKSTLKSGRSESYHNKTLGELSGIIAGRNGLQPVVAGEVAGIGLGHIDQTHESDIHLMTRICNQYGAVVNIKNDKLLVFVANKNQTSAGKPLSLVNITRKDGDSFRFSVGDRRGDYDNVSADWQDKKKAKRTTEHVSEGAPKTRKLKQTYKSKGAAKAAVASEMKRIKEQHAKFSITTAYAYPAITTESPVKLQGFKPQIDGLKWTVDKATHNYSKSAGLTTQLDLLATVN